MADIPQGPSDQTTSDSIELFDIEQTDGPAGGEGGGQLTPPAEVSERPDFTMANLHMGSADGEPNAAVQQERHAEFNDQEDVGELEVLSVRVGDQQLSIATETEQVVTIPVEIAVVLEVTENEQVTLFDIPENVVTTVGERNEDGSVTVQAEELEELALIVTPETTEVFEVIAVVGPDEVPIAILPVENRIPDRDAPATPPNVLRGRRAGEEVLEGRDR